ncbi:hypothetical protein XM38_037470 [Halomicronema hongdechloris C2206]|uniref:Uncharacterized protein n=1 Tax=Halomicronema hongdechloris C2206 TaxID=1641165 RepID=A0A1Z3HR73_9CYAN|nr:hypothetical protein [Halomicronema hongdechloris]ASC72788.1 hypothetical protein XM38_037470 [Halomicronema hongdechloris C2206]
MGGHHYQSINLIGISVTSLLTLAGCTYSLSSETPPGDDVIQTTHRVEIPEEKSSPSGSEQPLRETTATKVLDFDICRDLPRWQRLPEAEQMQALEALPRYGAAIYDEPLSPVIQSFWQHRAFSFTTYGLSARMEPLYFSGLWTVQDDIWSCYENGQPEQINAGRLAEVWLIGYHIQSLEWLGDRYIMSVEPRASGFQLIHFSRQEQSDTLPITISTTHDTEVSIYSGDW